MLIPMEVFTSLFAGQPIWVQSIMGIAALLLAALVVNYVLTILRLLSSGLDLLEKTLGCTNMDVVLVGDIKERLQNLGQIDNFSCFFLFFGALGPGPNKLCYQWHQLHEG